MPARPYYSSPAVAQVPRRCGEEVARVLLKERPLHVVNPEVFFAFKPPTPDAIKRMEDMGIARVTLVSPRRLDDALPFLDRMAPASR